LSFHFRPSDRKELLEEDQEDWTQGRRKKTKKTGPTAEGRRPDPRQKEEDLKATPAQDTKEAAVEDPHTDPLSPHPSSLPSGGFLQWRKRPMSTAEERQSLPKR